MVTASPTGKVNRIPRFLGKALQTLVFASQRAPRGRACSHSIHRDD
jgi:hypothetical protein